MKDCQLQAELKKGKGVTIRSVCIKSKFKVLESDSMIDPEGTRNQEELPEIRLDDAHSVKGGQVPKDRVQVGSTTKECPTLACTKGSGQGHL